MSEITVPAMGESITEGTIFKWHVKVGDAVSVGDVLLELETDKVNLEISAEAEGVVEKILRQEGENVTIGEVIGQIAAQEGVTKSAPAPKAEEPAPAKSEAAPAAEAVKPPAPAPVDSGDASGTTASPSARKLARERGIDLEQVQGRDPIGRIYHDDVKNHQAGAASASKPASRLRQPQLLLLLPNSPSLLSVSECRAAVRRLPIVWSRPSIRQRCLLPLTKLT